MSVNTYNSTTGVLTRVAGNGGGSFIYPHISITAETGSTVTITDGTATITAIETSEGLFEAEVIDLKTYTITATLNGETLTQTLDVDTVKKYSVDMGSTIPEGSTVTPTDDISIWLACAEITDKSYTTLAEVLADTDTYQLLLANSNACDYMARSTTWAGSNGVTYDETAMRLLGKYDYACDKLLSNATWASAIVQSSYVDYVCDKQVPKMTSATAPSGQVVTDATLSSTYYAYYAFDQTPSTFTNPQVNNYIGYKFTEPVIIRALKIMNGDYQTNFIGSFKVQGSNTGSAGDWNDITDTIQNTSADQLGESYYSFENDTAYQYYVLRLISSSGTQTYCNISEIQFYGRHASNYQEGKVAIHGARNATLYYKDGGSDITIGQTDSTTGIASVTLANIPTGTYAIYDGVAKDLSNLSNDYSKTVTITSNTTEVYLMPDNALYWWGYESSDLETPSQWPGQTANVACTKYTNYCDATPGSTSYASIGQKGITSALSKAHAVVDTVSGTAAYDVSLFFTTASTPPSFVYVSSLAVGLKKLSLNYDNTVTTPYCITVGAQKNCSAKIYALWYEE